MLAFFQQLDNEFFEGNGIVCPIMMGDLVPSERNREFNTMEGFSFQEIQGWKEEAEEKLTERLARAQLEYKEVEALRASALQMLQPVWPARLNKMVSGLQRLQGEIGADHDLVILRRSLRKTPDAFGGAETVEQLIDSLDHKSRKLRRAAEPLGRAIFDQTSRRFVRELGQNWNKWRKV